MKHHSRDEQSDDGLLQEVQKLLEAGRPDKALEAVQPARQRSKALTNAYGVCLMRTGQIEQANTVFRNLVVQGTGFSLDSRAPTIFKTNYATALLLGRHLDASIGILDQIEDRTHASVLKIRSAIDQWKLTLGRLRRLLIPLFGLPEALVPLPFPPGDIWTRGPDKPATRAT